MSSYRDDQEAAFALVQSLRRELADVRGELERSELERRKLERAKSTEPVALPERPAKRAQPATELDAHALLDSIPLAPAPTTPPPLDVRLGDDVMKWSDQYFETFAATWLATYELAGRLLYEFRGCIFIPESRYDVTNRRPVTSVIEFLCSLWREVPFSLREPWPYAPGEVATLTESNELEAQMSKLEAMYKTGWPKKLM